MQNTSNTNSRVLNKNITNLLLFMWIDAIIYQEFS